MLDLEVLGERIRLARERIGLSQSDLAEAIGRDQRTVSQYENGKRKILITDVPLLAHILKVPMIYFFEGDTSLDDYDSQILLEFHRLENDVDKTAVIELVRVFCDTVKRYTS